MTRLNPVSNPVKRHLEFVWHGKATDKSCSTPLCLLPPISPTRALVLSLWSGASKAAQCEDVCHAMQSSRQSLLILDKSEKTNMTNLVYHSQVYYKPTAHVITIFTRFRPFSFSSDAPGTSEGLQSSFGSVFFRLRRKCLEYSLDSEPAKRVLSPTGA